MIKAIYKRKGKKYCCSYDKRPGLSVRAIGLLSRAGIRFYGEIYEYASVVRVRVTNLSGLHDVAWFAVDQMDKAKSFLYSRSRDASPQLSLFWGAL
ncbi:MAG: hypothetical protein ABJQ78_00420 [Alloalcanivorax sp.]